MDELKATLNAAIDDHCVDGVLKALAEVLSDRADNIRSITVKQRWMAAADAVDRARLGIDV